MARPKSKGLTPKQNEVLVHLRSGEHPTKIAEAMGITRNGVYQHIKRIKELGLDFPEVERAKRGRPAGKKNAKAAGSTVKPSSVSVSSPAPTIEKAIGVELGDGRSRLNAIEKEMVALLAEQDQLNGRIEKLQAAQKALSD